MSEAPAIRPGPTGEFANRPIVIAGAGVAGLTAAIALQRAGRRTLVLERAGAPHELGAGIQLGPNAVRVLARLGLGLTLFEEALRPEALEIRDAGTAKLLSRLPLADAFEARYGAPYCVLARTALHRLLTESALSAGTRIRYASDVEGFAAQADGVVIHIAGSEPVTAAGLVGADGLWSRVRAQALPRGAPRPTAMTALRATIPSGAVRDDRFPGHSVTAWLAPRFHALSYRIDTQATLNLVVVIEAPTTSEGWDVAADEAAVVGLAADLAPPLEEVLAAAGTWRSWPLFDAGPTGSPAGAATLIGDAAHPMLPFIAQGAGMAIEDAYALAEAVAAVPHDLPRAFRDVERQRRSRVGRTAAAARRNGWIFHLGGPFARARDLALSALSEEATLRRFDWLYAGGPVPASAGSHSATR